MKFPKFILPEFNLSELHLSEFNLSSIIPDFHVLDNSHLNTIIPIYLTQNMNPNYVRERLNTPDKDFIDIDWVNKDVSDKPTIVLFHGAEGNSKSHYAKRLMYYVESIGWRGVVVHFRSCSEELNLTPKFYHAGETSDLQWVLETLKARTTKELFVAGVSLGGNALLKLLGEHHKDISKLVTAAIAISVPFDLYICTQTLDQGVNRYLYAKSFLNTLLPKMQQYSKKFDGFVLIDHTIETLEEFNSLYICPVFNFKDSMDYYTKASCLQYLPNINTPTMIIQAENDPMIPMSVWPNKDVLSEAIRFVATKSGGHAGFIAQSKDLKESLLKLPRVMLEFYNQFVK